MLSETELETFFSKALNLPIVLSLSSEETLESELSAAEKCKFKEMKHVNRKSSWLRGRAALRSLIKKFDKSAKFIIEEDLGNLNMPHPRLSLSHSGELAVAVSCLQESCGIGVDLERKRPMKEAASRFFLSKAENLAVEKLKGDELNDNLLRLWTVKEALFKADMMNQGRTVLKYELENALALSGPANTLHDSGYKYFHYASLKFVDYWMTVAVASGGAGDEQFT